MYLLGKELTRFTLGYLCSCILEGCRPKETLPERFAGKCSCAGVKLKCIPWEDGLELLAEIHGGICGSHIGSRALAGKAFRRGFFWPTALQDATALVTKCEACQFHSKKLHQPASSSPPNNPTLLAIFGLGARHTGPFPPRCWGL